MKNENQNDNTCLLFNKTEIGDGKISFDVWTSSINRIRYFVKYVVPVKGILNNPLKINHKCREGRCTKITVAIDKFEEVTEAIKRIFEYSVYIQLELDFERKEKPIFKTNHVLKLRNA